MNTGKLVISLDFELFWGMRDLTTIAQYGKNIAGVHTVLPKMLSLFNKYDVNVTFATVGFLFFENKTQLLNSLPSRIPAYKNENLSPYTTYLQQTEDNSNTNIYHYAPGLIKLIQTYGQHEVATHTFSHYYCLEDGQTAEDFRADLIAAKAIAERYGIHLASLVFPRNQYNKDYLEICKDEGITCIRGNEQSWLYAVKNSETKNTFRRALKLIDTYFNISGHNCYTDEVLQKNIPVNIPASRFLRPYNRKLKMLDPMKLKRIKTDMIFAARNNSTFHLWWHPHNFGVDQNENLAMLEKILDHFDFLKKKYNFKSYTMSSLAKHILDK